MFWNSRITDTKVDIYLSATGANNSNTFAACLYLKRIRKLIVAETTQYSYNFGSCNSLEEITFEGIIGNNINFAPCKKLNKASITSIITHLSSTTSGKTLTLSKTAVNKAFATTEGGTDGSSSDEWAALIATKTNWTITLS